MTVPYLLFQFQLQVQRNGKILNWNTAEKATKTSSVKGFLSASVNIAFNLIWYKWFKFHTNESMIKLPHDFFFSCQNKLSSQLQRQKAETLHKKQLPLYETQSTGKGFKITDVLLELRHIFFVFVDIFQSWVQFCLIYKRELPSFLTKLLALFFLNCLNRVILFQILPYIYIETIRILAHYVFLLWFWGMKSWPSWKHWLWIPSAT